MKYEQIIDTHALYFFVTVTESDSLSDAANRLGITQPAVSQRLKQLEDQIGAHLVIRRTSPVKLTVAGLVLKKNADAILGELHRLKATVRDAAYKGAIQCRIGFITSFAEVFGSKLIADLGQRTERLTLKSGLTSAMVSAFLNREIDVLISDEALEGEKNIDRFVLLRDPMLLVVSHQQIEGADYSLESLASSKPLIKYGGDANIGKFSEVVLRRMRILTNVCYETDDTHTLMSFVRDGHGWAVLPALCLAQTLHALDGVDVLKLDGSRHARTIQLIARTGEMGTIPSQIAMLIQSIFSAQVLPKLQACAPWMTEEQFVSKS